MAAPKSKAIEVLSELDLTCLDSRELLVLEQRGFFERTTQKILAAELGVSVQRVQQLEREARRKLFSQPQNRKAMRS